MKKIALFVDDVNRQAFYERISGIYHQVATMQMEVTLHVFHSRATYGLDPNYNIGEYNIFNLPDLSDYDGFILDLYNVYQDENYWYGAEACHRLIERVKATGKPVIAIGNEIEGCYYVGIDNDAAMREIIEHLYEEHGCREYWFIMGPADNVENRIRIRTCMEYLHRKTGRDYGDYVYCESFESSCGKNGFGFLFDRYDTLPQAIVCANDRIAIGAAQEAIARGCRIPEDFLLTGFDNIDNALCLHPSLSTVDQNWVEPGRRCVELLQRLWEGKEVSRESCVIPTRAFFRESCGCACTQQERVEELQNENVYTGISREIFDKHIDQLEYSLLSCDSLHKVGMCFQRSLFFLQCRAFYLVLDRNFANFRAEDAYFSRHRHYQSVEGSNFPVEGYPSRMKVVFGFEDGRLTMENRPVDGLFPTFESRGIFRDYLFLPIHFQKYTVGYFAIRDEVNLMRNPYLGRTIGALTTAIENLYNREKLRSYNQVLSDFSITDAMTGFYNRLGYQQLACRLFDRKKESGEELTVLFIDMDRLKEMNDRYGHECGDYALLAITKAIHRNCPHPALEIRMGGDEFLVVLDRHTDAQVRALLDQIETEIPRTDEALMLPYAPSISVGWIHTEAGNRDKTLDDYVREADEIMYEAKRRKAVVRESNL